MAKLIALCLPIILPALLLFWQVIQDAIIPNPQAFMSWAAAELIVILLSVFVMLSEKKRP
jgi:hypothetical protein